MTTAKKPRSKKADPVSVPGASPKAPLDPRADSALRAGSLDAGAADNYERFLPLARALLAEAVQPCHADVALAHANLRQGLLAVGQHLGRVMTELPLIKVDELLELPSLGLALRYAAAAANEPGAANVAGAPPRRDEINKRLAALRALREPMLLVAEGLALLNYFPRDRVARIRAGSGMIDAARDGVALEALYREYGERVVGKHPFSDKQLRQVADDGEWILRHVTPRGGRREGTSAQEAADIRDRVWTIISIRSAELRKVGFYLFGENVNEHVPLLQSRPGAAAKKM